MNTVINMDSLKLYFADTRQFELLNSKEERELLEKAQNGDEAAKEKMINSNLRLVTSIAKFYKNQGISYADLIQEGNIGLINAINKFDLRKEVRFSTYASWWIRQNISLSLQKINQIKIPAHMNILAAKVRQEKGKLNQELGYEPSIAEISKRTNISEEKIKTILGLEQNISSLDTPIGEEEKTTLGELIEDNNIDVPEESYAKKDLKKQLDKVLNSLTKREKEIIVYRYGLNGKKPLSLEAVGDRIGISRERVRQIEKEAMSKLRHPARTKWLKDFI